MIGRFISRRALSVRSEVRDARRRSAIGRAVACVQQLEGRRYLASISGMVYNDLNANGVHDSGEPGIQGVIINIDKNADNTVDYTAVSDINGNYQKLNLPAGIYRTRQQLPHDATQTSANPLDTGLLVGNDLTGVDFGDFLDATIHGHVFNDANANRIQDPGETNSVGASIGVDTNNDTVPDVLLTTNSSGNYAINAVSPVDANFYLLPSYGYAVTTTNPIPVNITTSGQITPDVNFGQVSELVVTNTNDSGVGSLRNAMITADSAPLGTSPLITFNIPGDGVQTIKPLTALPAITNLTLIDGTTQPGYAGSPLIDIDGTDSTSIAGFDVVAGGDGSTIRGFAINNFLGGVGIEIEGADNVTVQGCYIGLTADGTAAAPIPMFEGVGIVGSNDALIGGETPEQRNVISNNLVAGVLVQTDAVTDTGSNNNRISGNFIGTDGTGTIAMGLQLLGIHIGDPKCHDNVIGNGLDAPAGNVIGGNTQYGIEDDGTDTGIFDNFIGSASDGVTPIPNKLGGIVLADIGGASVGELTDVLSAPNVIAFNGGFGIGVSGASTENLLIDNYFYSNVGLGIDLGPDGVTLNDTDDTDTGPDNFVNFPVITSAETTDTNTVVNGTFSSTANPNTSVFLQLYISDAPDSSGYGEGKTPLKTLSLVTDPSGNLSFSADIPIAVPAGSYLTSAISVGSDGTSEFSKTIQVTSPPAPPAFSIDDVVGNEGNSGTTPFKFTVTRDTADVASTVGYATDSGSAIDGVDFADKSGTLSFAIGEFSKTITVNVVGDKTVESDEDFFVELTNTTNATVADDEGSGTIVNDDSVPAPSKPSISIGDASITEGNSGTKTLNFTVTLSKSSASTITVDYKTQDDSAKSSSDYTSKSSTLTFSPGQTSKTISITIKGDTSKESDEKFNMILSNAHNATIGDSKGVGTIKNDDGTSSGGSSNPSVSINDVSTSEGNSGTKKLTFTVKLSKASTKTVTVKYTTTDGTAKTTDNDYSAKSGTLTFAPGQTSLTISVTINGDKKKESDENFVLALSAAVNASITDPLGIGTINNDD